LNPFERVRLGLGLAPLYGGWRLLFGSGWRVCAPAAS
jgi:hypothetical protein